VRQAQCEPDPVVAARSPVLLGFGGIAAVGPSGPVDMGGAKQRAVLALLMLEPGSVVSLDRMVDRIWAGAWSGVAGTSAASAVLVVA
jgi:DNA-binding SARP family transcriptional activator